ncbi:MAG: hypothetical protein E6501_34540, partial [Bradyrhizobium sp.]|nr:hypothetical protein [Bradyrhizobium sp.]
MRCDASLELRHDVQRLVAGRLHDRPGAPTEGAPHGGVIHAMQFGQRTVAGVSHARQQMGKCSLHPFDLRAIEPAAIIAKPQLDAGRRNKHRNRQRIVRD